MNTWRRSFKPGFLVLFLLLPFLLSSQEYFQQEVDYNIKVRLDDEKHMLHGFEKIRYVNKAPNELQCIYMHLWPNAYKDNQTALAQQLTENGQTNLFYANKEDRGYIDSLNFKVDGKKATFHYDDQHEDVGHILLDTALKSGDTITITTPFRVKLPKGVFSRLGHMGESYQITQWYPKPAVYDNNAWHDMPYLNQGEFYSEFGSFDVSITLPSNYVIDATGTMVTEKERKWLKNKARKTADKKEYDASTDFPDSDEEMKTVRFKQDSVHDFAWFADKRYHVLEGSVTLPHSGREVTTRVLFTNRQAKLWDDALEYLHDAVYNYSLWLGDYPYDKVTAVDGALSAGGGMEYPNITVIGNVGGPKSLETVIMHEVGHNWFYGVLGSNERVHPWMDEGLNSYYENRYLEKKYPDAPLLGGSVPKEILTFAGLENAQHKDQYYLSWLINARRNFDQPIEFPSEEYTQLNYGGVPYGKSALVFDYLEEYLGTEPFDKAMKRYYETWKFKHPQPDDLRKAFEATTDKRIGWFFDELIPTNKKIDYKVKKVKHQELRYGDKYQITIKNKGDIAAPFPISVMQDDTVATRRWLDGFQGKQTLELPYFTGEVQEFQIDGGAHVPEINRRNNSIRAKGLFKKVDPLQLKFLGGVEDPERTTLYWTPLVAWNNADKWMAGLGFYNTVFPEKSFDYAFAPMYAFKSKRLTGSGEIGYDLYPRTSPIFQHIRLQLSGKQFSTYNIREYYRKFSPAIKFDIRQGSLRSKHKHEVELNYQWIEEVRDYSDIRTELPKYFPSLTIKNRYYSNLNYRYEYQSNINPFSAELDLLHERDELLSLSLTLEQEFQYDEDGNAFHLRLFGGKHLINQTQSSRYNWRMDGLSGYYDHNYEYGYLGRMERSNFLSHQFVQDHGGFKIITANGQSNDWLGALNIRADLPIGFPVALFADVGVSASGVGGKVETFYDAGVSLPIFEDILEFHIPVFFSPAIKKELEVNNVKFYEQYRFTLRLDKLDPFKRLRNLNP